MIKLYFDKIKRNINDFGYKILLIKVLKTLFSPIYQEKSLILYEIDISEKKREVNKIYKYKIINPKEKFYFDQILSIEEWLGIRIMEVDGERIVCGAALDGNKLIGFNFVVIGEAELPILKLKIKTAEEQAWSEQISVHKEYRQKGVANGIRETTYKELRKRKIIALYGHRAKYNIASKQSVNKYLKNDLLLMNLRKLLNIKWIEYTFIKDEKSCIKRYKKIGVYDNKKSRYLFELELKDLLQMREVDPMVKTTKLEK